MIPAGSTVYRSSTRGPSSRRTSALQAHRARRRFLLREGVDALQLRVEREDDVGHRCEVPARLALVVDRGVLDEAEPADVVGGLVAAGDDDVVRG